MATSSPDATATREQTDGQLAAQVALVLGGGFGALPPLAALSVAVLALFPFAHLSARAMADVAYDVARFTLRNLPKRSPAESDAMWARELLLRGLYAEAAARRLTLAKAQGEEAYQRALLAEERHLRAHIDARIRRSASNAMVSSAARLYGDVLGWYHDAPREPRPAHVAAHGKNFRVSAGPPDQTGVYPGELPNCRCSVGPPWPGGDVMASSLGM